MVKKRSRNSLSTRKSAIGALQARVGPEFLASIKKLENTLIKNWNESYIEDYDKLQRLLDPYSLDETESNADVEFFDPHSQVIVNRAVAGYSTYHLNPYQKFFQLESLVPPTEKISPDFEVALQVRENEVHQVMQEAHNFSQLSLQVKDKLMGGVCGAVIEKDDALVVVEHRIPPKNLALGAFRGRTPNVFGFVEDVSLYALSQRYPEVADPELMEYLQSGRFKTDGDEEEIPLYRFNILRSDLYNMLHRDLVATDDVKEKEFESYFSYLFGKRGKEDMWVDLAWCDRGILFVDFNRNKNILIGFYNTPATATSLSVGCGRKSLGLISLMAEMPSINFRSYERTFAPGYIFPDSARAAQVNLDQWGASYLEDPSAFRDTSLRSDVGGMLAFDNHYYRKLEQAFDLDVFELLKQTHMTKGEVNTRIADAARKLGPYLIADEKFALVPRVLFINERLQETRNISQLDQFPLIARYRSALAFAQKNSVFQDNQQIVEQLLGLAKLKGTDGSLRTVLDFEQQALSLVTASGQRHFLLSEQESAALKQIEMEKQKTELALQQEKLREGQIGNDQAELRAQEESGQTPPPV